MKKHLCLHQETEVFRLSKKSVTVKIIKTFFWIISLFKRFYFYRFF